MLISFQLANEDRGKLFGVRGKTINWLRIKHSCREILVRDNNLLIINNDDNQIISNIIFDIELILGKRLVQQQQPTSSTDYSNRSQNTDYSF